jgi:hypothetical protein
LLVALLFTGWSGCQAAALAVFFDFGWSGDASSHAPIATVMTVAGRY